MYLTEPRKQEDAVIGKVTETLKPVVAVTDDPEMKPEGKPEDKITSIATLTRVTAGVYHCDFSSSPSSDHVNEVVQQVSFITPNYLTIFALISNSDLSPEHHGNIVILAKYHGAFILTLSFRLPEISPISMSR